MLEKLVLKNIVIFEHLEVKFGPHLNAITGPPGSGKSILLEAVRLCCGYKFDPRLLMTGKNEGLVTLCFASSYDGSHLHASALPGRWIISRKLYASGQTKAVLNGQAVTLKTLNLLLTPLLHLYLQHSQQNWLEDRSALVFLDFMGDYSNVLADMSTSYQALLKTQKTLQSILKFIQQQEAERELHLHYLKEFNDLEIKPGEVERLQQIVQRYDQLGEIQLLCQKGYALCAGAEHTESENLACLLKRLNGTLTTLAELDPTIWNRRLQLLQGFQEELALFPRYFSEYVEQFETFDLGLEAEKRLDRILNLAQKHRCEPENLWQLHEQLLSKEAALHAAYAQKARLETELIKQREISEGLAKQLSQFRSNLAHQLGSRVTKLLKRLGLPHYAFLIDVASCPSRLQPSGCDHVTLKLQASAEQKPISIQNIASGGELSRIGLSLAYCMATHRPPQVLFFDEIDTGLSGQAAVALGKLLQNLAIHAQVITITHLPQVLASTHHQIWIHRPSHASKRKNQLNLAPLTHSERVKKLAQLLSAGTGLSESALHNAEDLILRLAPDLSILRERSET